MYGVVLAEESGMDADELAGRLRERGVETRPFFLGMHEQPALHRLGLFDGESHPVAERIARQGLYLPSGLTLTEAQIDRVAEALEEAAVSDSFGPAYARAYDALYESKDYESECDLLLDVLREGGDRDVRRILDLGCGTGSHALELAQRGLDVVGVDRSAEMTAIARREGRRTAVRTGAPSSSPATSGRFASTRHSTPC